MKAISLFALAAAFLIAGSCRTNKIPQMPQTARETTVDSVAEDLAWEKFTYAAEDFSFEIDSSNISEFKRSNDTIFISVFPPNGIDVEGRFLKMLKPQPAQNAVALQVAQGRYYIDSMGPDPVLDDMLLTGKKDRHAAL